MSYEKRENINGNEELELVFRQALDHMDRTIDDLRPLLSDLRIERIGDGNIVRFSKKDSQHAIVLKLVLLTSNLRGGWLLLNHGFVYQWSMLKRLLDETVEDILFLLAENQDDNQSNLHKRFLDVFYEEELDDKGNWEQKGVRPVQRREIRDFMSGVQEDINRRGRKETLLLNKENLRDLYRSGSGYIHGRASHIMSLYDPVRNRFHTDGLGDGERLALEREDFWLLTSAAVVCSIAIREQWGADEEYLSNAFMVLESLKKITGWPD